MRKQRTRLTPKAWAIVAGVIAILAVGSICTWVSGQTHEETPKTEEISVCAVDVPEENDYILNIPLSCELQKQLYEASEEFGVDYYIMIALIDRETKFANVLGDGGNSYGYCQIQPKWWYGLMVEIGATDLSLPKDNFRTACAILAQLTEKHNGIEGALVAYNQGYYNGIPTQYSMEIIANAERYRA